MASRRLSLVIVLPAALTLAACSSSSSGKGSTPASQGKSSGGTSSSAAQSATGSGNTPASSQAARLATILRAGAAKIRTAHLTLDIGVAGQRITGAGDEQVSNGKVSALQITENLPGNQQIRIVHVDNKTYAKLPQQLSKSSKPYVLVTATSSNATIRTLAQSIDSSLQSASVESASVFVNAAASVKRVGTETVDGVQATHYSVVVDPKKLPATLPGKSSLSAAGITSIPVEVYVDSQGRPVEITENLTIAGKSTTTKASVSRYNVPVTITAPPASQVQTG
jgi:hypothetical protein